MDWSHEKNSRPCLFQEGRESCFPIIVFSLHLNVPNLGKWNNEHVWFEGSCLKTCFPIWVVHISWPLCLNASFSSPFFDDLHPLNPQSHRLARVVGDLLVVVCVSRIFQLKAAEETIQPETERKTGHVSDSPRFNTAWQTNKRTESIFQLAVCANQSVALTKRVLKLSFFLTQPGRVPKK